MILEEGAVEAIVWFRTRPPKSLRIVKAVAGVPSITTFTGTKAQTELGAFVGSAFGPPGELVGAIVGSQVGLGLNVSYVNSTNSVYFGGTAVFAPLQVGGGGGISLSYTPILTGQNPNSIANGKSYGTAFQPSPLFGSVITK